MKLFQHLAATAAALLVTGSALAAPTLTLCADSGPARVDSIIEPWSESTRTFANGAIRITGLDTGEPACCSYHLAIMAPDPREENWPRQCLVLNDGGEWTGFQFVDVGRTQSSYDPSKGLLLSVPVERYIDGLQSTKLVVDIRINQATGEVTIE